MNAISSTSAAPNLLSTTGRRKASPRTSPERVHEFVADLFDDDVHMTRVLSFANGVIGVIRSVALGILVIGRGFVDAMGFEPKHATKQIDRVLSNEKIGVVSSVGRLARAREELKARGEW